MDCSNGISFSSRSLSSASILDPPLPENQTSITRTVAPEVNVESSVIVDGTIDHGKVLNLSMVDNASKVHSESRTTFRRTVKGSPTGKRRRPAIDENKNGCSAAGSIETLSTDVSFEALEKWKASNSVGVSRFNYVRNLSAEGILLRSGADGIPKFAQQEQTSANS